MLESLLFIRHNRRAVEKSFWRHCWWAQEMQKIWNCFGYKFILTVLQRKTTQNLMLALWSSPRTQNVKREWLIKWKGLLYALEALARLSRTLYGRQLWTKHCSNEFSWDTLSGFVNLYSRKTRYRRFLIFLQKDASRQLYKKNNRKQANNARWKAGELLGIPQVKYGLYLDPKPSPRTAQ